MSRPPTSGRPFAAAVSLACLLALVAASGPPPAAARRRQTVPPPNAYRQHNLVSDLPGVAPVLDPRLADPWALTRSPVRPFAAAARLARAGLLYRGGALGEPVTRNPDPPAINLPFAAGQPVAAVANSWPSDSPHVNAFTFTAECVNPPCPSGAAHYIFGGPGGHVTAWFPALGDTARTVAWRPGHNWTGMTIVESSAGVRLLAADFAGNHVDAFDADFNPVPVPANRFDDPTLPAGFHPYNIQHFDGSVYVTYASFNVHVGTANNGAGLGFVRKFNADGERDPAFAVNAGALDAPYGLAISPAGFGPLGSSLLVGNNAHRSRVNAYNFATGEFRGTLHDEAGRPVEIEFLRGLAFGGGLTGDAATLYFNAGLISGLHGLFGSLRPSTPAASTIRFAITAPEDSFHTFENAGHFDVTVLREGDTSGTATVDYATADENASQARDYQIALGRLTFAPGETAKTFRVLLVDDHAFAGGSRVTLRLILSNPAGAALGAPREAGLTISDDEGDTPKPGNPVDGTRFFVLQHYYDFLNRVPGGGLDFWSNEIEQCGADQQCREVRRINVSAAFFLSIEFQRTGMLAYLTHRAAFGRRPLYGEFMRSTQALQRDYAFGAPGHEAQLEANKQRFFADFVAGPEFVVRHPASLTPEQFADALYAGAGFAPTADERKAAVDEFGGAATTEDKAARARALRRVAELDRFAQREFRAAFVTMQYFGYLRRDPDEAGFQHWLAKLDQFDGNFVQAEMVKAFITSIEYRGRFGPT